MTDIATRVYNHTWKIDPIVRSVLDTDFYKLLMAQTIFRRHRDAQVTFGIINRTALGPARRADRHRRAARAARPHPHAVAQRAANPPGCAATCSTASGRCSRPTSSTWLEGFRFPAYHLERQRRPVRADLRGAVDRDHDVGDPGARRADGAAHPRRHQGHRQVRAAGALCARHDAGVGEDRAAASRSRTLQHRRLRHAPPARLPVAGLVRAGDDRGAWARLPRHLELPDRHAPRGRGDRHQRARVADGLLRRWPTDDARAGGGALPGAGRLAGGLRRQPAHHAARHLRHRGLPRARARLGRALDRHPHRLRRSRSRAARSPSTGGSGAARTRARSSRSSPTGSTSRRSSACTAISTAACASASAGAPC